MGERLLVVEDLYVTFYEKGKKHKENTVVQGLSFHIEKGEILGIVGESGSGKTMTGLSIMGLLTEKASISKGSIFFCGKNLCDLSEREYQKIRGKEVSMIFQEPMTSLNPLMKIGKQVEELLRIHEKVPGKDRKERVFKMFRKVELQEVESLYHKYPHQLSGGMRQRVMIAMAMICKPKLLIADEPTTALDITVQKQILRLMRKLNQEYETAILFISHDLAVIQEICSRALVMHDGRIIESGTVKALFHKPRETYTKKLLQAISSCKTRENQTGVILGDELVLRVENLRTYYKSSSQSIFSKSNPRQVLHDLNLQMHQGEILGIVGESGSGKSTFAKTLTGIVKDYEGTINLYGNRPLMVFQDPYSSLNPAKKVGWILEEPLKIQGKLKRDQRKKQVAMTLEQVGLKEEHGERYLAQLSGGQRQRVSIANAIITNPKILILDEPVSSLDVTIQEQVLELLLNLKKKYGLSYLFISHDLNVIRQICHRVCVMYQGKIIEIAPTEELFRTPQKEYTKMLIETIPGSSYKG